MRPTSPASFGRPLALALALLALAGLPAAPVDAAQPGEDGIPEGRISDERRTTYWGFAERREPIRRSPALDSQAVGKVRLGTELGAPEVYLALRRRVDADGGGWLQVRIPTRPNGRVGWVRERALGELHVTYTRLVINLRARRARLFENGTPIWSAPVGIGTAATPTPRGRFYVRERLHLGGGGGVYGSFAFGTSAYAQGLSDWPGGGVVGVHGTNRPGLIPGRVSHGCVRLRNAEIRDLRRLMGLGTPILIR